MPGSPPAAISAQHLLLISVLFKYTPRSEMKGDELNIQAEGEFFLLGLGQSRSALAALVCKAFVLFCALDKVRAGLGATLPR